MFVLKNCNDPELSEAKTLLFKTVAQKYPVYSLSDVSIILFTGKTYLQWPHQKNPQNDRLYAYPSTKKKDAVAKHTQLTFTH